MYVTEGDVWEDDAPHRQIAVLCDGMGGMTDGARASETAVTTMAYAFDRIRYEDAPNIQSFFKSSMISLDRMIHEFPREDGKGSGTTMVSVVTEGNSFYIAAVGDSRIYYHHWGKLKRLTRDHNHDLRLRSWLAGGMITEEQYKKEKKKKALISFLGVGDISLMDISKKSVPVSSGDILMLCSDGVTGSLSEEKISEVLLRGGNLEDMAEEIVRSAVGRNPVSQDNTSIVLLRYTEA